MSEFISKPPIPYGKHWIDEQDIMAVADTLRGDLLTQGLKIEEFERAIAQYCGAKYGVAVSSGTAALHSAYAVAGISSGDEVIMSPLTFSATASTVVFCAGKPVFADIEEDTLNVDIKEIEKKITNKTKVIAPVDFAGHSCDYDRLLALVKEHNLLMIEDASHALGSEYHGQRLGFLADMTILSFHPVKHITTGEGGMVLTNNEEWHGKLKTFRHHGIVKRPDLAGWYYEIKNLGNNYRITDFQCALGLSQLKKLDNFIKRRREIGARYNEAFQGVETLIVPKEQEYSKSSYHLYIVQLRLEQLKVGRKEIFDALRERGIGVQVHYMPLHLHPFYAKTFGYKKGDFPKAETYYNRALTLPLYPKMTDEEVERVIIIVKEVIAHYTR